MTLKLESKQPTKTMCELNMFNSDGDHVSFSISSPLRFCKDSISLCLVSVTNCVPVCSKHFSSFSFQTGDFKNWAVMADYLPVWLVLLGAGCHTASKNWAFWRLPTLNQFSLVTGMRLTAAAAVCVCVPLVCMFMYPCTYVHV